MTGLPKNTGDQADYMDDVIARINALEASQASITLEQDAEPTQSEWEAAWVAAGNALPIPVQAELFWYRNDILRGQYSTCSDVFCMPISTANQRILNSTANPLIEWVGLWWWDDDSIVVDVGARSIAGVADDAVGTYRMWLDGSYEKLSDQRIIAFHRGSKVGLANVSGVLHAWNMSGDADLGAITGAPSLAVNTFALPESEFAQWDDEDSATDWSCWFTGFLANLYHIDQTTAAVDSTFTVPVSVSGVTKNFIVVGTLLVAHIDDTVHWIEMSTSVVFRSIPVDSGSNSIPYFSLYDADTIRCFAYFSIEAGDRHQVMSQLYYRNYTISTNTLEVATQYDENFSVIDSIQNSVTSQVEPGVAGTAVKTWTSTGWWAKGFMRVNVAIDRVRHNPLGTRAIYFWSHTATDDGEVFHLTGNPRATVVIALNDELSTGAVWRITPWHDDRDDKILIKEVQVGIDIRTWKIQLADELAALGDEYDILEVELDGMYANGSSSFNMQFNDDANANNYVSTLLYTIDTAASPLVYRFDVGVKTGAYIVARDPFIKAKHVITMFGWRDTTSNLRGMSIGYAGLTAPTREEAIGHTFVWGSTAELESITIFAEGVGVDIDEHCFIRVYAIRTKGRFNYDS
jgi:hypothetical protein